MNSNKETTSSLMTPPTDEETSRLLMALGELVKPTGIHILRRLLFQRDRLLEEVKRLKEGWFTEGEFQNLCHNMTVDGQPVNYETVHRFQAGCREYQQRLFGSKAVDMYLREAIRTRQIKNQRSFSIQTEQGQVNITEYVLEASSRNSYGVELKAEHSRLMIWIRDNKITDHTIPIFSRSFIHEDKDSDLIFNTAEAEACREDLLKIFCSHYGIQKVAKKPF